jgi:SAM-dependent methyltransferase
MKPWSEACERNRGPILAVLREAFADRACVLEVGSGTGQHAVHFARHLPHLTWQPSDRAEYLAGIRLWVAEAGLPNLRSPLALDVNDDPWPQTGADAVFSANTLHILNWRDAEVMFERLGTYLPADAVLAIYGPFRYAGRHTAESNARFDLALRQRDPSSGIRDFEAVDALARAQGFALVRDQAMPANNRTLIWGRASRPGPESRSP